MKTRIFWLDALKGMAISLVVLAHILWVQDASASSSLTDGFLTANRILASLGVPLFVMVSGALLFNKQFHNKADICVSYRRGLLPLILSAWIWIAAYCVFNVRPFSLKELLLCMMFIHKPEVHLWYVRVILICYLTVPFINMLRRKCGFIVWPLLFLLVGFTFCYNGWLILNSSMCPTSPTRSYFCYFVYMALGYWLSRTQVSWKGIVPMVLIVVSGGGNSLCLSDEE